MKAALWIRVSKAEENQDNQLRALQELATRRGLEVVQVYGVEASAWKGAHQVFLEQVYQDAHSGQWQVLVVWALDRLTREKFPAVLNVIYRLETLGATVLSFQQPWLDMRGPARELLLAVFGWVASEESRTISERTKAGLDRRKAQGLPVGRQPGAKDKQKRKRSGQVLRRERERETNQRLKKPKGQ